MRDQDELRIEKMERRLDKLESYNRALRRVLGIKKLSDSIYPSTIIFCAPEISEDGFWLEAIYSEKLTALTEALGLIPEGERVIPLRFVKKEEE